MRQCAVEGCPHMGKYEVRPGYWVCGEHCVAIKRGWPNEAPAPEPEVSEDAPVRGKRKPAEAGAEVGGDGNSDDDADVA